jgi:hypothetical protein
MGKLSLYLTATVGVGRECILFDGLGSSRIRLFVGLVYADLLGGEVDYGFAMINVKLSGRMPLATVED